MIGPELQMSAWSLHPFLKAQVHSLLTCGTHNAPATPLLPHSVHVSSLTCLSVCTDKQQQKKAPWMAVEGHQNTATNSSTFHPLISTASFSHSPCASPCIHQKFGFRTPLLSRRESHFRTSLSSLLQLSDKPSSTRSCSAL